MSCTRTRTRATPRRRAGSRRSPRPTTCSPTRPSARSTTRRARCSRAAAVDRAAPVGSAASAAPGGFGNGAGSPGFDMSDLFGGGSGSNLNDLFDGLFGANAGRSSSPGPVRGQDVSADITLGFDEAVRGSDAAAAAVRPGHVHPVPRLGREARDVAAALPDLPGHRLGEPQPGRVRVQRAVPRLPRHRPADRRSLPAVPRHRLDHADAHHQRAHPRGRARRRQDPDPRQGHARAQRRAVGRPDRHGARRQARAVRPRR